MNWILLITTNKCVVKSVFNWFKLNEEKCEKRSNNKKKKIFQLFSYQTIKWLIEWYDQICVYMYFEWNCDVTKTMYTKSQSIVSSNWISWIYILRMNEWKVFFFLIEYLMTKEESFFMNEMYYS